MSETNEQQATGARTIKRYANRKLYDTERSCYVTLDEITTMVKSGEDVRIIDNRTGEDLSSVTLAQIVYEEEKKQKSILPLPALRQLIRQGGEILHRRSSAEQPVEDSDDEDRPLGALLGRSQEAFEDLQRRMDERIQKVIETMTQLPSLQTDVTALERRIKELEARIEELESSD